ncbi:MAG: tRNA (adenosine(37)-N6)-threonylcarbamoyltransferase complex ATPase subunit type 1 TsaE [bacterium]
MRQEIKKSRNQNIKDLAELQEFARKFALEMRAGEVYGFSGDLGAGKTTLIQMIGRELGITVPMTSPTFVFRKEYAVNKSINQEIKKSRGQDIGRLIHIDAYRIESGNAEDLGELRESDALTFIEWPERIEKILPPGAKRISIEILKDESRKIVLT